MQSLAKIASVTLGSIWDDEMDGMKEEKWNVSSLDRASED
jgi:hypothetical protein